MLEQIEETYERIHGEEIMLAASSIPHIAIQRNLSRIIGNYLKGKRCQVFFEARVVFDNTNWFQPDLIAC